MGRNLYTKIEMNTVLVSVKDSYCKENTRKSLEQMQYIPSFLGARRQVSYSQDYEMLGGAGFVAKVTTPEPRL